jgi:hypothetical protein
MPGPALQNLLVSRRGNFQLPGAMRGQSGFQKSGGGGMHLPEKLPGLRRGRKGISRKETGVGNPPKYRGQKANLSAYLLEYYIKT